MGLFGPSKEICRQCRKNKTRRRDEKGEPLCAECEIQAAMDAEDVIECPIDNQLMKKEQVGDTDLIIDRCPKCGGVWLDGGELETLKQTVEEESDDSGANFCMGFATGIAIG